VHGHRASWKDDCVANFCFRQGDARPPELAGRSAMIVGVDGPAASCAKVGCQHSNLKDRPDEP